MSDKAVSSAARQRITALLDENSFVEIGGQITARSTDFNLQEQETPSDGVITGYGVIDGNPVYVYSQDVSVLNGTIGEMHGRKIVRLYQSAMKLGVPVIGLLDCAGIRLQESTDALNALGEIYKSQAMASGVIPQITAVFGNCGGGLAMVAGMSDFTFMEETKGRLFVNAPNAIDGNEISRCDTSSAAYQSQETGLVDVKGTQEEILEKMRDLIGMLPPNYEDGPDYGECTDDLNRVCGDIESCAEDGVLAISRIADDQLFLEIKADYGKDMAAGFIRLNGATVGAVANCCKRYDADGNPVENSGNVISSRGAKKAARFVRFCDAYGIPVLTLTNVRGYKSTKCAENNMAEAVSSLTYAFAQATVPKVNVIIKEAYGSAYAVMNSKALGADMVYAWPDAKVGMMDAGTAAKIMYEKDGIDVINEKARQYEKLQNNVLSAARRGYVDAVIAPEDTRKYVIAAFEMLFTKREDTPRKKHGTI